MKTHLALGIAAMAAVGIAVSPSSRAEGLYRSLKEISVPGEGGWDYLSIDEYGRRLYVSHGTRVAVIDINRDLVIGEITNTPGVHGLAVAPRLQRGLTTNGGEHKAGLIDLHTLQTIKKIETGQNPDGMLFDPGRREFYTFNGRGQSATVIDAREGSVVATVALGGRPEFAAIDTKAGRVYDNLEDKSEVAVIDTTTHSVASRWPIAPGEEASGMAIDEAHHRLFIGCHNKMMVMMDSTSGKVVTTVPIGAGVDANAFDPGTQLAFASCGDGTVTIAREETPEKLTVVQTLETQRGSRTMALDPVTHRIYLAAAQFEPPKEGQRRGRMIPGTFKILVYEMAGEKK